MTQKELNYIEDFYNHCVLYKNILLSSLETIDDMESEDELNNQLNECDSLIKNTKKLVEGEC